MDGQRTGECFECGDDEIPVFTENEGLTRDYCADCIRKCVFCQGYCDWNGCYTDEGHRNFIKHDCIVDGKVTCDGGELSKCCQYRYCMTCTAKCSRCGFNIVLRGGVEVCAECLSDDIVATSLLMSENK